MALSKPRQHDQEYFSTTDRMCFKANAAILDLELLIEGSWISGVSNVSFPFENFQSELLSAGPDIAGPISIL